MKIGVGYLRGRLTLILGVIAIASGVTIAQHVDPNTMPEPGATPIPAPRKSAYVKPATAVAPRAPQGFTVSVLTEGLPAGSRWMSMAPNGDIFVSGFASNQIMVLRDGSKDGRYNTKFIYLPTGRGAPGTTVRGAPTPNRGNPQPTQPAQQRGGQRGRGGNNFVAAQAAQAPWAARGTAAPGNAAAQAPGAARGTAAPGSAAAQAPGAARGAAAPGNAAARGPGPTSIDPSTGLPRGEASTRAAALACNASPPAVTGTTGLRNPMGMAFLGDYMYIANTDSIVRYKYTAGDTQAVAEPPERVAILPSGGLNNQRNIVFNRAGTKMYVSIGSNTNNSAGEDCRRAAIMEFNPDGSGGRIYASGLRNPLALAWQPNSDILWTTVTERTGFGDDLVPDFATALTDGGFYGWPYAYIGKHYDPRYLGGQAGLVKNAIVPDIVLPAHSAPSGIAFYAPRNPTPARQFPAQFWGMFLSLSGSTNDSSVPRGFKVVFVPFQNGKPAPSAMVDFVTGFVSSDAAPARGNTPINFWGRPTALLVGSDGSLLILDETDPSNPNVNSGKIWKVTYTAPPPAAP